MTWRAIALLGLALGCSAGQRADQGSVAQLQVRGGGYFAGDLPAESGGPTVEAAYLGQTQFPEQFQGKSCSGVLSATASALAVALDGDDGYWIIAAGPPLTETPDLPSFDAALSFSAAVVAGPQQLRLAAVDDDSRFGPRKLVPFTLSARPAPEGPLVFSLAWDRPSDLDLSVELPSGVVVDKDNVNSARRTGSDADADAFRSGGQLDLDSNSQCRIDGRNGENVSWSVEPPSGRYIVRIGTFSLCSEPAARWSAEARYHGEPVAFATGESLSTDTLAPAGVVAFELQVR